MKLRIALSLTLAVSFAAYACSSSGSSASPGTDASTPDDSGVPSSSNGDDAGNQPADASNATTDSSNGEVPDSSNGNTLDSSTNTSDSSTPATDAGALSFATDIYAPIIEPHCVGCHALQADGGALSGVEFGKLDMSTVDAGYANLVNVPAAGVSCAEVDGSAGPVRVVPGNAASSLLWDKVNAYLDPPAVCGNPMPRSGEIPDGGQAAAAAQIQTWINQGALP